MRRPLATTIFFSWQSDRPASSGRKLVEQALGAAVSKIATDVSIEKPIRDLAVDRDTLGVPGSPAIVDTVLRKIDKATVFVPDFTFVGERQDGRPMPNPNVMIEYGWALRAFTYPASLLRILPVMNTAFGEPTPDAMPFNVRHLRNPILYYCPPDADEETRIAATEKLAAEMEEAIRLALSSDEIKRSLPQPEFVTRAPLNGPSRFRAGNDAIGLHRYIGREPIEIYLSSGPACWMRLSPLAGAAPPLTVDRIEEEMRKQFLLPLAANGSSLAQGFDFVRGTDGFGVYGVGGKPHIARTVLYIFTSGEVGRSTRTRSA
jgi:hypothetical protein